MKTPILDPDGRAAVVITAPIPGRTPRLVVLLYPDGRGRLADIDKCRPAPPPAQPKLL